jgi:hypothetical protein
MAVPVSGFFATAGLTAADVAGAFLAVAAVAAVLADALFWAGVVMDPPAQARSALARAAAKVRIFRMISETVYQDAEIKYSQTEVNPP